MSNHTVKILSALTVAGAMVLSSSAAVAEPYETKDPTPWASIPLKVAPSSAARLSVAPLATTSAVPPQARLSVWIRPNAPFPPVMVIPPKGVAYVNGAWQVFNPVFGTFCIKPAATTGIYVDQVFPVTSVDYSQSRRAAPIGPYFAQWMPNSPPALPSSIAGVGGGSSWCDWAVTNIPGSPWPRGSYIDIETLRTPLFLFSNLVSFNVVVQ